MNISLKNLLKACLPPVILFVIHIFAIMAFNIYVIVPNIDMPMHFLGGAAIGITAVLVYRELLRAQIISQLPFWLLVFLCVSVVALVATCWEFLEYLSDVYAGTRHQDGLRDTMSDMALGLIGGFFSASASKLSLRVRRGGRSNPTT